MKKGDVIWILILGLFVAFLAIPSTHVLFIQLTTGHPYISGFIKFALLATMGELLAGRIKTKVWKKPHALIGRVVVWGILGIIITLIFQIYAGGVTQAMANGYLPFEGVSLAFAFFTSALMNLFFAPTFMALHRFTDSYFDLKYGEKNEKPTLEVIVKRMDIKNFIAFIILKTIPFFWIPAHTITFLLPNEYRVLAAAFLSMALGLLLALGKRERAIG